MKSNLFRKILWALMVCTGLTTPALARLGETQAEINKRFGKGKTYRSRGGLEQREYQKNGMTTYVVFGNTKSIWELTKRNDKVITDADIQTLLNDAATGGHTFVWQAAENYYLRDDGKVKALRQPRHADFFSIMDIAAIEALEDVSRFGCLGMTPAEVARLYGQGTPYRPRDGMEQREYGKNGYTIQVVFKNGHAVWEFFKREDIDITDANIQNILTAVGGGGFTWDAQAKCFIHAGKMLKAGREPGHSDFLFIKDEAALNPAKP